MSIVVSIVSFNTKKLLGNCLQSIFRQKFQDDVVIWVVDNASSDGSIEKARQKFSEVLEVFTIKLEDIRISFSKII